MSSGENYTATFGEKYPAGDKGDQGQTDPSFITRWRQFKHSRLLLFGGIQQSLKVSQVTAANYAHEIR